MNMRFKELFDELKKSKRIRNQQDFVERIDSDKASVSNALRLKLNPTNKMLAGVSKAFPDVNIDWLLTGDGEMFTSVVEIADQAQADEVTIVPLLPIAAQAGPLSYFTQSVQLSDCERVISPIKGADYAMRVAGDSMSPEFPNGSQVLIKKIDPDRFIEWGKVFVLDTCNGTVLKQLAPGASDDTVTCLSLNPSPVFAPFQVYREDIIGIYRVLLCMSIK